MIIYGILLAILSLLSMLGSLFGSIIPDFPPEITTLLDSIVSMFQGALSFISYFTYWPVMLIMFSLIMIMDTFHRMKNLGLKVFSFFIK